MKIIDIYDGGGYASTPDNVLADRLRALAWRGESVGAIRRRGATADALISTPDIAVRTSGFGLGFRLTLASMLRRLMGEADRAVVVTHDPRHAEQVLLARRALSGKRVSVVLEIASGIAPGSSPRMDFIISGVDMLMFHSTADRDSFTADRPDMPREKAVVVQPGVSVPAETKESDDTRELVILWAGRITADCRLIDVVEAMGDTHRTPVKLIVAGQGDARASVPVLKRARSLGLDARVEWLGDAALTPALLLRADALILPSPDAPDNFTLGAAAMASGLPLIVASSPRMGQLAQDDVNAIFYNLLSPDTLIAALRRMADNPWLRRELGRQARAKAEAQYDLRFVLDQIITCYSTLLV